MRPVIFLSALLLAACNTAPEEARVPGAIAASGQPVLTINGDIEVYEDMWKSVLDRIPPEQRARMEEAPGGMKRLEEQMAMSQVLYNRALAEGVAGDPEIAVGLAMAERDYLAAIYVQRHGDKAVTDEAIAKTYEERKVQYARPQVQARHILVKEESKANEIKAKLDAGGDFAALAKEFSQDPGSKDKGGDLGWFEQRRMDPTFAEAAFGAEKGSIVGPVSTRFGFHIIEVQDKRETVPLDDVKEEIAGSMRQEAIQEMLTTLQTELKIQRAGEPAAVPNPDQAAPADKAKVKVNAKTAPAAVVPAPAAAPAPAAEPHGDHDGHNH